MIADIRAQSRAVSAALHKRNRMTKKFAGAEPANSRENVDGWFTSDTRSRPVHSRTHTACKPAAVHRRQEAVRNTAGSRACNKACSAGRNNTVNPQLRRRREHRSKRSRNHAPRQRVPQRDPLPTYWQWLMQEEFVGTCVSPFPLIVDKRPLGRFRCFFGPSLNHESKNAPSKQGVDG